MVSYICPSHSNISMYSREMYLYLVLVLTLSVPGPCEQTDTLFWPVFVIATIAAMIASQAMISATFSCVKQSMSLGCFPRLKIVHTSRRLMGQIYIPVMNWFLMIMCIVVVAIFRSTTDIANAYG
jgi:K+ transporter